MKSSKLPVEKVKNLVSNSMIIITEESLSGLILSWIAYTEKDDSICLNYAYTKQAFRRMGLASQLIQSFIIPANKKLQTICKKSISILKDFEEKQS
jgi:hypothetical protein